MSELNNDTFIESRERWLHRNLCRDCMDAYTEEAVRARRLLAELERRYGHLAKALETWPA